MKKKYLQEITTYLFDSECQWPDFLIDDCKTFIDTLHIYRLKHLLSNISDFSDYINLLSEEYNLLSSDESFALQAKSTIQALFTLSCVEFVSASQERMLIRSFDRQQNHL